MSNTLLLEVVTPQGLAVKAEVDQVEAPSVLGEFGVLPGHLPLLVALRAGVLRYRSAGKTNALAVGPGFAEAGPGKMTVLTDLAMQGADVDTAAARADRDEAQKKIDGWQSEASGAEYDELVRDRDWGSAQLDAARESGKTELPVRDGRTRKPTVERLTVATLDAALWDELWRFAAQFTEGSRAAFEASLRSKKWVVVLRDRATRDVVGMGGIDLYPLEHEGRRILVLYSGNLLFAPGLRGQGIVQREGFRAFLAARLRHPRTPFWFFYDTFSFRSYLMLPNNFGEYWPRYDQPTPPAVLALLDRLGRHRYGEHWDPERGLCRRGERTLREGVATVTTEMLANPHIRYFSERNPGYAQGDMLAVLIPLTARNWLHVARRALARTRRE